MGREAWPADLTLVRSPRKTISLHVSRGDILVRAPLRTPQSHILALIQHRLDWARERRHRYVAPAAISPNMPLLWHGETRVLGTPDCPFSAVPGPRVRDPRAWIRRQLINQYRTRALDYFNDRSAYWASQLGVQIGQVSVRDYRGRWGSCSHRGDLAFNWRLMMAPPAVADYVCVHEVCHRLHMNHSAAFWAAVSSLCPDWKQHRHWLHEHGSSLMDALPKTNE